MTSDELDGDAAERTEIAVHRIALGGENNAGERAREHHMPWLKRRFVVNEKLELSSDTGLVVEVAPRVRRVAGGARRLRVRFDPPEQFKLNI